MYWAGGDRASLERDRLHHPHLVLAKDNPTLIASLNVQQNKTFRCVAFYLGHSLTCFVCMFH